ncbi:50S ribosomal protein L29 [Patescibacteria group bacterium]
MLKELREKNTKDLDKLLLEKKERLSELNFSKVTRQMKNPREIRNLKKDIAKINTLVKEKQQGKEPKKLKKEDSDER